jgi:glucokinase
MSATSPRAFAGLDIGGTAIKAMAFSPDGKVLAEEKSLTGDDGSSSWIKRARSVFDAVTTRCPQPIRVGVAAPGLPAENGGSIRFMPGRLRGLENLNWQKELGFDVPVPVLNDAQAALLGETWLGASRGCSNVILLTLGTGVGGAAMVDGRILRGHIGRAGHLGHTSLDPDGPLDIVNTPGSLEDAISEHTLPARSSGKFASTRDLVVAVRQNSTEANQIWLRSVRALAAALAGFVNVLDPEVVILGGGIADAGESLFGPLQSSLDQFEWRPGGSRVRVIQAQLGPNAGAVGAARAAQLESDNLHRAQSSFAAAD